MNMRALPTSWEHKQTEEEVIEIVDIRRSRASEPHSFALRTRLGGPRGYPVTVSRFTGWITGHVDRQLLRSRGRQEPERAL